MHTGRVLLLGAAVLLGPLAASAQQAQTSKWVHVRAGPAREYPLVTQLPPAAPVAVQGCLSDFSWCDVITPDNLRGWVYGGNLVYPYQNGSVPIIGYGANIGLPVVTFVLGAYWGSYYRARPWYGDWHRWDSWSHNHFRPGLRPPPPPHRPDIRPPPRPRPPGNMRPPPRPPGNVRPAPRPPGNAQPPGNARPPSTRPAPRPGRGEPGGGQRPQSR